MKKYLFFAALLLATASLTSCTDDGSLIRNLPATADDTGGDTGNPPPPPPPPKPNPGG